MNVSTATARRRPTLARCNWPNQAVGRKSGSAHGREPVAAPGRHADVSNGASAAAPTARYVGDGNTSDGHRSIRLTHEKPVAGELP